MVSGLFKLALASLLAGSLLSLFGITPRAVLDSMGMTAEDLQNGIVAAFAWAAPRMLMGAVVILPVWLVAYLLMPPRG
ncbi:DUF6460 domain-containing protein [Rhizobium rosettiformans]|jgi:hypothetical protein|uniref:DUF6460 domain-containing protein n=1 Tax=Rhizobium rosettiformans TaxID=1368430 RepID=UPI00181EE7DA|nr:DUF6460 domain-containing protein [Rhizobium rosettiformans]MBA4795847.1 hypothetical protein [Hyphomicrobiales bacterium]MDR7028637.1 hypothetical protein [Rhizobium rosettiformans]MDR7064081.1 hypothetical protein [Rhizobium rosettiformans]